MDVLRWIGDYFNLSREGLGIHNAISWGWQLALYGALVLGIVANGFLAALRSGKRYRFRPVKLLVSAVIGLVLFPAVYDGAQANLGQPTLVQLAAIFAAGLGYESLFSGVAVLVGRPEK